MTDGPAFDPLALQELTVATYDRWHAELDFEAVLAAGRELGIADRLATGGAIVFPHIAPADCAGGTVVALGPLHGADDEIQAGYDRVDAGEDGHDEPLRGIYGPGAPCGGERSDLEHSLMTWRLCWEAECTARQLAPADRPTVLERHPCFAGSQVADLPGIEELESVVAGGAVVVASVDPFHHGTPYGTPAAEVVEVEPEGRALAEDSIRRGISALADDDYDAWSRHCIAAKSDAIDVGLVLMHLLGSSEGELISVAFSDASSLYDGAESWAAGALWVIEPAADRAA